MPRISRTAEPAGSALSLSPSPSSSPSSPPPSPEKKRHLATRIQAVTLRCVAKFSYQKVTQLTGMNDRTLQRVIKRAMERGFDPESSHNWRDEWFEDAIRPGRPSKQTISASNEVNRMIRLDRYARGKSSDQIAADLAKIGIKASPTTIWRMLRNSGNH